MAASMADEPPGANGARYSTEPVARGAGEEDVCGDESMCSRNVRAAEKGVEGRAPWKCAARVKKGYL